MSCNSVRREIVESAHAGNPPGGISGSHLNDCGRCRDAYDNASELARHFRALHLSAADREAPRFRRAQLMQQFDATYAKRRTVNRWRWATALAAGVLLLVGGGPVLLNRLNTQIVDAIVDDASDLDGFIAVPYAPETSASEILRVVRTELYPAALASLGVDTDPSWTGKMPAELLVGEDGYPRAVRISAEEDGNSISTDSGDQNE